MRRLKRSPALVIALAIAVVGTGCGSDEPVERAPAQPFKGPYLESFADLERELTAAGVEPRRTGPADRLERRSVPRPLRSETLVTSEGTRMSVLVYDYAQTAVAARSSVREATPGRFRLERADNLLVVITDRAPDTPQVREVLTELDSE
jgi:hypothetical protein